MANTQGAHRIVVTTRRIPGTAKGRGTGCACTCGADFGLVSNSTKMTTLGREAARVRHLRHLVEDVAAA